MPTKLNRLSVRTVASLSKPGRHADGGNLYLNVTASGAKSWIFLYRRGGRQREMGLGSVNGVSLAQARESARVNREKLAAGEDPIASRDRPKVPTFGDCADDYIAAHEASWSNPKHVAQWRMTLTKYAAHLRTIAVDKIVTEDVLKVLKPIWQTKPETASRLRGRIEVVLNAAAANKHRSAENPARWTGNLKDLLSARKKLSRGHHAALPHAGIADFMGKLRERDSIAARALEFAILTAARTSEVIEAQWDELDLERQIWTVPASRMKTRVAHRVPLADRAILVLSEMQALGEKGFVFPGNKPGASLSNGALERVMDRMKVAATVHGFRSTFRDWAAEVTNFPHEVCEMALAHKISSDVEAAYRRGDLFAKRTKLMEAWSSFCGRGCKGNVVNLLGSKGVAAE